MNKSSRNPKLHFFNNCFNDEFSTRKCMYAHNIIVLSFNSAFNVFIDLWNVYIWVSSHFQFILQTKLSVIESLLH